ncbi:MAG: NTP transferase domain-containing protein, partial [Muribaculaceae bacterium]|nr:NTP transferase domain-containing protein [Muribaculaceae bacterium]
MKFIGVIPARYASTRFPGKPLAKIGGKMMIERVWERVKSVLPIAVVATDDERIYKAVKSFGGNVVMTSTEHRSGTDRCNEAFREVCPEADVVINIQGEEPIIEPAQ